MARPRRAQGLRGRTRLAGVLPSTVGVGAMAALAFARVVRSARVARAGHGGRA
jgi:hypothetical protein